MARSEKSSVLAEHGLERGSVVRIRLLNKKFSGVKELDDALAHVEGGTEAAVTLAFIGHLASGYRGFVRRTLPWGVAVLDHAGLVGEAAHARLWLACDEDPCKQIDLSMVGEEENGNLFELAASGMSPDDLFSLLLESCDHEGLDLPADRADAGERGWAEGLRWREYANDKPIMRCRFRLMQALMAREDFSTVSFIDRVNHSLDELKDESCERRQRGEWANGRMALIGTAWWCAGFYGDLDMSDTKTRSMLLTLLGHALEIEYESPDRMTAFWASVPPLPGLEEEHGRMVLEAVAVHLERPDVEWRALRAFLYEGGIDRAMRPLEKLGLSPNVFAQAMLKRWGADPDIAVFIKGSPTSFAPHDQTAAVEVLIDGMRTYEAHVVARVVGGRSVLWQRLDDGQKARLIENVRQHLEADRRFTEHLWMCRDQLPGPFETYIRKAYNGH